MKLMELTDWQKLMEQASWTVDYWYGQAGKLGISDESGRLKYAELCLREFENSAKLRVVDVVSEKADELLNILAERA